MDNAITPQTVRDAAVAARVTLREFLKQARVSPSTFYAWEKRNVVPVRPLTWARLADAIQAAHNG